MSMNFVGNVSLVQRFYGLHSVDLVVFLKLTARGQAIGQPMAFTGHNDDTNPEHRIKLRSK